MQANLLAQREARIASEERAAAEQRLLQTTQETAQAERQAATLAQQAAQESERKALMEAARVEAELLTLQAIQAAALDEQTAQEQALVRQHLERKNADAVAQRAVAETLQREAEKERLAAEVLAIEVARQKAASALEASEHAERLRLRYEREEADARAAADAVMEKFTQRSSAFANWRERAQALLAEVQLKPPGHQGFRQPRVLAALAAGVLLTAGGVGLFALYSGETLVAPLSALNTGKMASSALPGTPAPLVNRNAPLRFSYDLQPVNPEPGGKQAVETRKMP